MPSAAALNVRIGGDIKQLERALKDAEKAVRDASSNLANAASQMSTKISLPIIGFGIAALKSAGDIEALQKAMEATFKNAGRTIGEAGDELEALRRAAEAPGLDFPEAVKASIRLQNVGLSAESARDTIIELANAVATTGGSAENLGEVTNQFSQMISKGKIYNEDLKIIKGQMPVLSGLMQETFGTTQADRLQELGVTGREFVEKMTTAMKGLNRAEGGISNAIVNAGTSIKMFLASVGESLNKTFNISGKLGAFATWMDNLASYFKNLDEGTKKAVGAVAVFALTLGPLMKVGQGVVVVVGYMIQGFGAMQIALQRSLAGQAIPSAIAAFKALSLATKLTIIGAAIGIILAAAAAFAVLKTDMSDAAVAARSVENVNKKAAESIAGQKSEVDTLVAAYKAEGTTLEQKKQILAKLNQISPEYFNGLKVGKGDVTALTAATGQYVEALLSVAKITAAKDRLVEIEKAMLDLNKTAEPSMWQTFGNAVLSVGKPLEFAVNQAESFTKNLNEQKSALDTERQALLGMVVEQTKADASTGKLTDSTKDHSASAKEVTAARKKLAEQEAESVRRGESELKMLKEIQDAWVKEAEAIEATMAARAAGGMATDPTPQSPSGESELKGMSAEEKKARDNQIADNYIANRAKEAEASKELAKEWENAYIESAQAISNAIGEIFTQMNQKRADDDIAAVEKEYAVKMKAAKGNERMQTTLQKQLDDKIQDIKKKAAVRAKIIAIAEATINTALAISKANTIAPPGNVPAMIAAAVIGAAQIAVIAATPMAKGTKSAPGGLALVGEQGPELVNMPRGSQVFPTPKTNDILNGMARNSGSGAVYVSGEFLVRGEDLVLVLDRANQKNIRLR